jgi:hypothetical protein
MSFKEWLPITTRNQVALAFAAFSLALFVIWNCVPLSHYRVDSPVRVFAMELWPSIISFRNYVHVFKSPDLRGLMSVAACFGIFTASVMSLLTAPFWKLFHATPFLRIPIAVACLFGGLVVLIGILSGRFAYGSPREDMALSLVCVNMFSLSAALFTFRNELALRSERAISRAGGSQ